MTTYQLTNEGYVIKNGDTKVPTVDTPDRPNTNQDYFEYRDWLAAGGVPEPAPESSRFERDQARYAKRAAARDGLLAYMAADNMGRVRAGTWTVPDLMGLLDDPAVAAANAYMSTLSYELAAQAIATAATPLLTPEIRADWIARLTAHFYLEV